MKLWWLVLFSLPTFASEMGQPNNLGGGPISPGNPMQMDGYASSGNGLLPPNQMPNNSERPFADLSFLPSGSGACSFEPKLSADDLSLLSNAERAIVSLRESDKCKALVPQIDAFTSALKNFNQLNGSDQPMTGFDGAVSISCANYNDILDLEFEHFVGGWEEPSAMSSMSMNQMDVFMSCRMHATREEAITCGATLTAKSKSKYLKDCLSKRTHLQLKEQNQGKADAYAAALNAFQTILNSDECIDSSGDQKLSFMQAAVNLAGKAASLSSVGTPAGLLIGASTDVISSIMKQLFKKVNDKKDGLNALKNRENFTKIACLYDKLEDKAFRCERISASREVANTQNLVREAQACIHENMNMMDSTNALSSINAILSELKNNNSQMDEGSLNEIVKSLRKKSPFGEESLHKVATQLGQETLSELNRITASDENLADYVRKNKNIPDPSGADLREAKSELTQKIDNSQKVLNVLNSIDEADKKGTNMGEEDLQKVSQVMKNFEEGSSDFVGAYNDLMSLRASLYPEDDMSKKIIAFNARMDDLAVAHNTASRFFQQQGASVKSFEDGGRFNEARMAIAPHLKKLMEQELDVLVDRSKALLNIKPGAPTTSDLEMMRTKEEEVLYPILRACNQLQSVANSDKKNNFNSSNQPAVCAAFNCSFGTKTFQDFLSKEGVAESDAKKCDTISCQSQYHRYVCQEKKKIDQIRINFKEEFLTKGTICGKPLSQALGGGSKSKDFFSVFR